jgi:hypothetical protein
MQRLNEYSLASTKRAVALARAISESANARKRSDLNRFDIEHDDTNGRVEEVEARPNEDMGLGLDVVALQKRSQS